MKAKLKSPEKIIAYYKSLGVPMEEIIIQDECMEDVLPKEAIEWKIEDANNWARDKEESPNFWERVFRGLTVYRGHVDDDENGFVGDIIVAAGCLSLLEDKLNKLLGE